MSHDTTRHCFSTPIKGLEHVPGFRYPLDLPRDSEHENGLASYSRGCYLSSEQGDVAKVRTEFEIMNL